MTRGREATDAIDALLGKHPARVLRRSWPDCSDPIVGKRPSRELRELLGALDVFQNVSVLAQLHGRFRALPAARPADRNPDLEPRQFALLYQTGTWLMLPDLDRTVAAGHEWLPAIGRALGAPRSNLQCNLYVSSGKGRWSPPRDFKDAFYLGIRGEARFRLGRKGRASAQESVPRGTALFVPRGLTRTLTSEAECHLLAFELRQPTWLDLVDDELYRRLVKLEHWREPVGSLRGSPDERAREVHRLEVLLARVFQDLGPWNAAELVHRYSGTWSAPLLDS